MKADAIGDIIRQARLVAMHWRDQGGVNAVEIDKLADMVALIDTEPAYEEIVTHSRLLMRLRRIAAMAANLERGCDCEYDHRCGRCSAVIAIREMAQNRGGAQETEP